MKTTCKDTRKQRQRLQEGTIAGGGVRDDNLLKTSSSSSLWQVTVVAAALVLYCYSAQQCR
jgi:hypothetical protein